MKRAETFYVWRRLPDGYIHASAGYLPQGWTQSDGVVNTFEELGCFKRWGDAHDAIVAARAEASA